MQNYLVKIDWTIIQKYKDNFRTTLTSNVFLDIIYVYMHGNLVLSACVKAITHFLATYTVYNTEHWEGGQDSNYERLLTCFDKQLIVDAEHFPEFTWTKLQPIYTRLKTESGVHLFTRITQICEGGNIPTEQCIRLLNMITNHCEIWGGRFVGASHKTTYNQLRKHFKLT